MPFNSRAKGKTAELEVAGVLRSWGYGSARRGRQFSGSQDSPDVVGLPGWHIEVKRVQTFSLYPAINQAIADAGGNRPVVFHRRNHQPWVAILTLDDFMTLMAQAQKNGQPPK